MISFSVNKKVYELEFAVFDLNGTLALDGVVSENVKHLLSELARRMKVYILTSDTFGTASSLNIPGVEVITLPPDKSASFEKKRWIEELGAERCVAIGNGYNDHLMLEKAALSIAVCWREGACGLSLEVADIVVGSPEAAIELLLNPKRIVATLRD